MNEEVIKAFVQKTLGCGCPEEVFRHIDCGTNIVVEEVLLKGRINVGNRLLIYVAEADTADAVRDLLPQLLSIGRRERDHLGFNRFRLVLSADNTDEIMKTSEELFAHMVKDEKVHLHVVQKGDLPI